MIISSEIFDLVVDLIGMPLCWLLIRNTNLAGASFLLGALFSLLLSNIFTVIEGFYRETFFNGLEHMTITLSAVLIFVFVVNLIRQAKKDSNKSTDRANT